MNHPNGYQKGSPKHVRQHPQWSFGIGPNQDMSELNCGILSSLLHILSKAIRSAYPCY